MGSFRLILAKKCAFFLFPAQGLCWKFAYYGKFIEALSTIVPEAGVFGFFADVG